MRMKNLQAVCAMCSLGVLGGILGGEPVNAIMVDPPPQEIQNAVQKGRDAAQQKVPPSRLFWHFGSKESFQPHGFLMTKIGGLSVLATHYALRGEEPTQEAIQRVVNEKELQVIVTVYGEFPTFARESYLIMKQGEQIINPERVRADGRAISVARQTGKPIFRAKIVASFPYGAFDPEGETVLKVFPGAGGEIEFPLELGKIP